MYSHTQTSSQLKEEDKLYNMKTLKLTVTLKKKYLVAIKINHVFFAASVHLHITLICKYLTGIIKKYTK